MYLSPKTSAYIEKANRIHNDRYDYSNSEYITAREKILIRCVEHGEFLQTATDHLCGSGCPACANNSRSAKHRKTTETFITDANKIHGIDTYDYSRVIYRGAHTPVIINCPTHGEFCQRPTSHLNECGCPVCANERTASVLSYTTTEFATKAKRIHNHRYDYSLSKYANLETKIIIICPEHGKFMQTPASHLNGSGCADCSGNKKRSEEEFIRAARQIHNNKYEYEYLDTEYRSNAKIKIICHTHGKFMQMPSAHLSGQGCPKCVSSTSKEETEWLDSLNIPGEYRQKLLYIGDTKVKTDAYNPVTNTIYEYWGDFWHGNPEKYNQDHINPKNKKTYGELYSETQIKRKLILNNGYNLIEIWGSEFKKSSVRT